MSGTPISAVLYDTLVDVIKERRVKVAVFLTFQFEPEFFEQHVLPVLFKQDFSLVDQIRLVQLEERLRSVEHLAVYYDRRGLGAESARLDYRRIGLQRHNGYFHPKNIMLLLENQEGYRSWESLLLLTTSANLTKAGWWTNVEVAHVTEVHAGEKCTFRSDLLAMLSRLKQEDTVPGDDHTALDEIHKFLRYKVDDSGVSRKQGRWLPQFYYGQEELPDFLSRFIDVYTYNMEVISPFFDRTETSQTLSDLIECLQPKATRIFLPIANDGSAECLQGYFDLVRNLPHVYWGVMPETITQAGRDSKTGMVTRNVHAKVYRFWNQTREILFIGSVNLTSPAHTKINSGNFESGILVENEVTGRQGWWLEALERKMPVNFRNVSFEDTSDANLPCNATFCFNWETDTLLYLWESPSKTVPGRIDVLAQNVLQFSIEPVKANKWISLPAETTQRIKELLKSTSLVEVRIEAGASFHALIREEGMAHKPALFTFLTAEEILHYWSLLSQEQREHFIAQKSLWDIERFVQEPASSPESGTSMFDRFAGIFHAFGSLEEYIRGALQSGREAEAVYRLLGEKHDSLSALLEKVVQENKMERVHQYVTLLCAHQLVDRIEKDFPEFKEKYRRSLKELRERLAVLDAIEAGFSFETAKIRTAFFAWFREMFLKPAKPPESLNA